MKKIITNELIGYKSGFIDGKDVILNIIDDPLKDNKKIIENNNILNKNEEIDDDNWYLYGYNDAYKYYLSEYIEHGYILKEEFLREGSELLMQRLFMKRVAEHNKEKNDEIVGSKFKM